MEKLQFRFILSAVVLFSLTTVPILNAAPVRFNQVVQVVNAKPGKADDAGFTQLRLGGDVIVFSGNDDNDNDKKKEKTRPQQDDRVITETTVEIVEEEVCDCEDIPVRGGGFPYWALPFAAIPFFFIPWDRDRERDPTPTPTPPMTPTMTPTPTPPDSPTPTPTPPMSPTPTPTPPDSPTPTPTPPDSPTPTPTPPKSPSPTPTPPMTPTPTPPEPIPEPMTILLFGTGLAGIGLAARRKFGKKKNQEESEE